MSIAYDPRSHRAEEFINDEEIRASLAYGEENKNNAELIDQILAKALTFKGLTHRETAVLLANEDPADRDDDNRKPPKIFLDNCILFRYDS